MKVEELKNKLSWVLLEKTISYVYKNIYVCFTPRKAVFLGLFVKRKLKVEIFWLNPQLLQRPCSSLASSLQPPCIVPPAALQRPSSRLAASLQPPCSVPPAALQLTASRFAALPICN